MCESDGAADLTDSNYNVINNNDEEFHLVLYQLSLMELDMARGGVSKDDHALRLNLNPLFFPRNTTIARRSALHF